MTEQDVIAVPEKLAIITVPEEIMRVREAWVTQKREELTAATQALEALRSLHAGAARLERCKKTVGLLRKVVRALEHGYIPIPRFRADTLRFELDELPLKAILSIQQAQAQKLFDEYRLVTGGMETQNFDRRQRRVTVDPLIIGVTREPTQIMRWSDGTERRRILYEEHFLVAWWRPEDLLPWDGF